MTANKLREGKAAWMAAPSGCAEPGKSLGRAPTSDGGAELTAPPKRSEILERQLSSEISPRVNPCITLCLLSPGTLGLSSSHHTTIILCLVLAAEGARIISAAQFLLWMFLF